jgi:ABC-type branched-subunit amino acid transport system substrate-binding protein
MVRTSSRPRARIGRVALILGLVVIAGCGARVSDEQLASVSGPGTGASGAVAVQDDGGTGFAAGDVGPSGVESDGDPSGATSDGDAATQQRGTQETATSAPAGGNGGATDVGVTADSMTIGNVSTLSGPVPGLFSGAVTGTQAFIAYQNSLGGVFGRKLELDVRDDQFDTGQNRAQTTDLTTKAFALIGSFSLYDDAGLPAIEQSGIPNIQVPLTQALQESPANFSINPVRRGTPLGPWNFLKSKFPGAVTSVGGLYGDVPAAKDSFLNNKAASESVGYKFIYERGFAPTETDFTADVVRMRQAGVKFFFTNGDVKSVARMAKAMQQQQFKPEVFVVFGPAYDASFIPLAGTAAEGVLNIGTQAMYLGEDAPHIPEVALMNQWLNKVKPGYKPDLFAAYGWGSMRLFVKALQDAGPSAKRADVVAALKKIDNWNGNGMFPPAGPASKRPATCYIFEKVVGGKFERWESPPPGFRCNDGPFYFRK